MSRGSPLVRHSENDLIFGHDMLALTSTSDSIQLVTSSTASTDVHATWISVGATVDVPARKNTAIITATTTTIVPSPAAGEYASVKAISIRNKHATTAQTVTVVLNDGTTAVELMKVTMSAGETLHYQENGGFWVQDSQGRAKTNDAAGGSGAAVNALNLVVLSADVVNNNATANTMADVTGLSFPVTAGESYDFEFHIDYTAAATTTGSRWSINGPTATRVSYSTTYALTTTSNTFGNYAAYELPAASNASSANTTGNIALILGTITAGATGTVTARFASEIASSAITAKAGSLLKWYRTI